jgi:hypothetical protein
MIFPFVCYDIDPTPTIPSGIIRRPEIRVRIIGPNGSVQISGLLDTGADNVFISASVATALGIEMHGDVERAWGAGSHELEVWPARVEMEVAQDDQAWRWPVEVGFLVGDDDPPIAYLGQSGFLEHFTTVFDTDQWIVQLVPHQRFPGSK